jgi:uncharacterized membrane protein required for colicin V production
MERTLHALQELAPVDVVGLCIVALLVILGLFRGLWWQVIRLVGLCAAVAVARLASPGLAAWELRAWPELPPRLAQGSAWLIVFLLALGAASLLGLLGQRILEAIQLGWANRFAGGILGAVTGLVLHAAALVVMCQLGPAGFVERHVAGSHSERLVQAVGSRWKVVLGAEASAEVDRLLRQAAPAAADGSGR